MPGFANSERGKADTARTNFALDDQWCTIKPQVIGRISGIPGQFIPPTVDGDLNPPDSGERRGLVAGTPVIDLGSCSVC
jgi:hypothetical protein